MAAYRQLREDLAKLQRDLGLHHVVRRLADADEERRERVAGQAVRQQRHEIADVPGRVRELLLAALGLGGDVPVPNRDEPASRRERDKDTHTAKLVENTNVQVG